MYGTIFRIRPRSGREADVVSLMEEWTQTLGPRADGARAVYLMRSERHPGELLSVAVFENEDAFRANAATPEQDAWYQRLRETLESNPEWEDGEYLVAASTLST